MTTKHNDQHDDQRDHERDADGLTPTQRRIRDACGNVPRNYRRSIDRFRVARGMPPLWSDIEQRGGRQDAERR